MPVCFLKRYYFGFPLKLYIQIGVTIKLISMFGLYLVLLYNMTSSKGSILQIDARSDQVAICLYLCMEGWFIKILSYGFYTRAENIPYIIMMLNVHIFFMGSFSFWLVSVIMIDFFFTDDILDVTKGLWVNINLVLNVVILVAIRSEWIRLDKIRDFEDNIMDNFPREPRREQHQIAIV